MKKLLLGIAAVIVIVAISAGLLHYQSPDRAARRAIERYGGQATGATVRVDRVQISPVDGSGVITGFSVGNPSGYKTPAAITAASIKVTLEVASLDRDPVAIRTLLVVSPRITYESAQSGSNFSALLENVVRSSEKPGGPGRKIIVDRVVIRDASLSYASPADAGQTITVNLPDMFLNNIGRVKGGATAAEFATAIVEVLFYNVKRKIPASAVQAGPQNPPGK